MKNPQIHHTTSDKSEKQVKIKLCFWYCNYYFNCF